MINRYPQNPELAAAMRELEAEGRIECFEGPDGHARWRLTDPPTEVGALADSPPSRSEAAPAPRAPSQRGPASSQPAFDLDVPFGPIDEDYSASDVLVDVMFAIAALEEVAFRFWCAMTTAISFLSIAPCEDAEEGVVHVIGEALAHDCPIDRSFRPIMDSTGCLIAVLNDDGDQHPADEWEALCFAIVNVADLDARTSALIELAEVCAQTDANAARSDAITAHSLWRAEMRPSSPAASRH